jgi:hypothetical protein
LQKRSIHIESTSNRCFLSWTIVHRSHYLVFSVLIGFSWFWLLLLSIGYVSSTFHILNFVLLISFPSLVSISVQCILFYFFSHILSFSFSIRQSPFVPCMELFLDLRHILIASYPYSECFKS